MSKKVAAANRSMCVACGACQKECPKGVITIFRGCYAVIDGETCVGCGKCTKICPAGCIEVKEREQ